MPPQIKEKSNWKEKYHIGDTIGDGKETSSSSKISEELSEVYGTGCRGFLG